MDIRIVNHRTQRIAAIIAQAAIEVSSKSDDVMSTLSMGYTPEEILEVRQLLSGYARQMATVAEMHGLLMMMEDAE